MTMRTLLAAAVLASATTLVTPATAHALLPSISPGDRIDYISDRQTETFCTLGYVYTGDDDHVYGITAGHCQPDVPGYMRDENSSANGTFVRTSVSPARTGGPDYGLIDFGRHVMAVPFIGDTPVASGGADVPPAGSNPLPQRRVQRTALRNSGPRIRPRPVPHRRHATVDPRRLRWSGVVPRR